jgi:hypothetical protein
MGGAIYNCWYSDHLTGSLNQRNMLGERPVVWGNLKKNIYAYISVYFLSINSEENIHDYYLRRWFQYWQAKYVFILSNLLFI